MGDTRRNQYFIPGEGIAREVITADICKYLDNDALVRPGNYQGIDGYYIFAYRNLTREMIEDLKADSSRWDSEKRNRHRPNNRGPTDYVNSRTHASRAETGPSYADDPYANGGGGMGGSGGLPPRGSLPPTGVAINSRQNASPYSNDAGGFGSNGYPPAQPRSSTGLPSTSAYPSNPHLGASSGGPPFAGASSGAPSFGVSAPTSYGGSTTQSYPPPPSTAPTHGSRGAFADSSAPRPPRTDMRSGGGYDYGDSRADSRPYTDQSRSGFGSADSGRRRY